jgi:Fe-S-cluster containining protein
MSNKIPRKILKGCQEELNHIIYDFSDCSICALCCKNEVLTLKEPDINRISKKLGMDKKSFLKQYSHYNEETNETVMNMPCPFLKNNRCELYSIRPEMCRNFPIFVLDSGLVAINEIESCAKATHFIQLFIEFISKEHPEHYEKLKRSFDTPSNNSSFKNPIKNAYLSINYIARFTTWLAKKTNNTSKHRL